MNQSADKDDMEKGLLRGLELLAEIDAIGGAPIIQGRIDEYSLTPEFGVQGMKMKAGVHRYGGGEGQSPAPEFIIPYEKLSALSVVLREMDYQAMFPEAGFSDGFHLKAGIYGLEMTFSVHYIGGQDNFRYFYPGAAEQLADQIDQALITKQNIRQRSLEDLTATQEKIRQERLTSGVRPEPSWY